MLSVAPGRAKFEMLPPALFVAVLSVVLSITATEFCTALKTSVSLRSGESAINPGCVSPERLMAEGASASLDALTIFRAGTMLVPLARSGFETNARNLIPLTLCWLEEELLPQERQAASNRHAKPPATTLLNLRLLRI
jgi:hypothetical protein